MAVDIMAEEERARHIRLCRSEAERWRRQASLIRDHATLPHLTSVARATLLHSAASCDDEADHWEAGARAYEAQDASQEQVGLQRTMASTVVHGGGPDEPA